MLARILSDTGPAVHPCAAGVKIFQVVHLKFGSVLIQKRTQAHRQELNFIEAIKVILPNMFIADHGLKVRHPVPADWKGLVPAR